MLLLDVLLVLLSEALLAEPDLHRGVALLRGFPLQPAQRCFAVFFASIYRVFYVWVAFLVPLPGGVINTKHSGDLRLRAVDSGKPLDLFQINLGLRSADLLFRFIHSAKLSGLPLL